MCALPRRNSGCIGLAFPSGYTLRSLALRAVVADTKELCTVPYDIALPVLFIREQSQMGGFESAVGYEFFYLQCLGYFSFSFMLQGTPSTTPDFATLKSEVSTELESYGLIQENLEHNKYSFDNIHLFCSPPSFYKLLWVFKWITVPFASN